MSPASEATDSFDVLLDNDIPTGAFLLRPSSNKSSLALSIALNTFLSEGVAPSILRNTCSNILLSLCNQRFPSFINSFNLHLLSFGPGVIAPGNSGLKLPIFFAWWQLGSHLLKV